MLMMVQWRTPSRGSPFHLVVRAPNGISALCHCYTTVILKNIKKMMKLGKFCKKTFKKIKKKIRIFPVYPIITKCKQRF